MENQIENFKKEKTQRYYRNLKMFAIMQRESNRVVRELWTLVKNALNDISPNAGKDEEFQVQPIGNQEEQTEEKSGEETGEAPGEAPEE